MQAPRFRIQQCYNKVERKGLVYLEEESDNFAWGRVKFIIGMDVAVEAAMFHLEWNRRLSWILYRPQV